MSNNLQCYICGKQFGDNELTVPINLNIQLPFGTFHMVILSHYMCALDHLLDSVSEMPHLLERDRLQIEKKLMTIITNITKGTVQ